MADVTIDGIRYVPADNANTIGVAITTRNRRKLFERSYQHWNQHAGGAHIIVIDDASDTPVPEADYRFETQAGIARAKNKAIELLMDAGVEHIFLSDDDTWPITPDWADKYIGAGEPHLMYLFKDPWRGANPNNPPTIYDDGKTYAFLQPRGCLLYIHRSVVERIGGMRLEFGTWGHEHVEYSRRAHAAGLTSFPFQDVCGSRNYIHACDERETIERTVNNAERQAAVKRNDPILESFNGTTDFVNYRQLENVVLTTLFTARPDPQRGKPMKPDLDLLGKWQASLQGCRPVILADQIEPTDIVCKVPSGINPYLQRWISIYRWLRDNETNWVWATDGTDVEMLQTPWDMMRAGTLYVGHEPSVVGIPWMRKSHVPYQQWIDDNADRQLLNAGVVGGDHATLLEFAHDMCRQIATMTDHGIGDMAAFNFVAYQPKWDGRREWGSRWVTTFKKDERNEWSVWKHK